jgi:hypothetical protein
MFNDENDLEANRNELETSELGVCNIIPSLTGSLSNMATFIISKLTFLKSIL